MVQVSYPGVYIQEVPSGVRTIVGVATSITAFIGRTWKGPDDEPATITSLADYERNFGGLWRDSSISYAVQHSYQMVDGKLLLYVLQHVQVQMLPPLQPLILEVGQYSKRPVRVRGARIWL